jgi:dethiobiotin synthetase
MGFLFCTIIYETIYNRNRTDVGKTIAAAIITVVWGRLLKPIQAGDLDLSDSHSTTFCQILKQ